jgi:hypothetical protein
VLGLVGLLLLMGCATGTPVGFKLASGDIRHRRMVPGDSRSVEQQRRLPPGTTVDSSRTVVRSERTGELGTGGLARYKAFIQGQRETLSRRPEEERRVGEAVLRELEWWLWQQEEAQLARQHPLEVYLRLLEARQAAERKEAARWAAVEEKLEEYWRWAESIARNQARQHFRPRGREHLLTESALWEAAQNDVVSATLAWAYSHTQEEDFLRKSPSEVALYLLATRGALAQALMVGRTAPPQLDYTPVHDKTQQEEEEDEVREVALGMLPVTGELLDFSALVTGYNVAGRRALTGNERLLCAVGVLLPLLSGKSLGAGGEVVEKVALATGRSADEVHAMVRVARQVAPEDAARLERISRTAVRTGRLAEEDWDFLQRTARHLDSVLAEFHEALKRGERVPFLALRTGSDGLRLVPGSAEHMAQAWMEYQFRHPGKYPHFRYAPDEQWRRMYRAILENKAQGSTFEREVLQKLGHEKNTALLMPPPDSRLQGFIPDAVPGNPNPGELVWGQPYRFVEAKARAELSLTGNLKAMLDYVEERGGALELWVRSAKHHDGPTRLSKPLQQQIARLRALGRVNVQYHP